MNNVVAVGSARAVQDEKLILKIVRMELPGFFPLSEYDCLVNK